MKILLLLALASTASTAATLPVFSFNSISESIPFLVAGGTFLLSGPEGTLSGTGDYLNGDPGLVAARGNTSISVSVNFAADIVGVEGAIGGMRLDGQWCVPTANFETLSPVSLPAEVQEDFITSVPAMFSGARGLVMDSCTTGLNVWASLEVAPVSGTETLTFEPLDGNQGWQLIRADFIPAPEPSALALMLPVLLGLAVLAKQARR